MANIAQTSICGIGLGAENCYVAIARQGGIEIVLNEYSQYATPAFVLLGGQQRELGTSAKQGQMAHLQTTFYAPSLLLGKKYSELDLKAIPFSLEEGPEDSVLIRVNHNDEELVLTPTQLLAMMFTKLRHISGNPVDCVINVPNFFNDIQRRQMKEAAQIAGLNPLMLINDTTAVALFYGFYRKPSDRTSSIMGFFDCGQSSFQSSIFLFNHNDNSFQLLDTQYESAIGGRDFDQLIANHFIESQNLELNKRARVRLFAECEKLKKQMSANSNELPVNIECLYNDRDFSGRMDRAKFQELAAPLFEKIQNMLARNLEEAKKKFESNKDFVEKFGEFKVDSVEIFGGSSRIPSVKQMVKTVFGIEPSTTLNADEAVARGCALQCTILSPSFKIAKELKLQDGLSYQVNFSFDANGDGENLKNTSFNRGTIYPVTKKITGQCKKFPIRAIIDYVDANGQAQKSAEYLISEPAGTNLSAHLETNPNIVFRLQFDSNGVVSMSRATYDIPRQPEPEPEPMEESGEKMEVDASAEKKKKSPKPVSVELVVQVVSVSGGLTSNELQKFIEVEANLVLADRIWKEKTDAKNALEEYIYEWREKLSTFEMFVTEEEKELFQNALSSNETWLYEQDDEGIMHSKSVYEERSNKMKDDFSGKILYRKRVFDENPALLQNLGQILQQANKFVETADPEEKENVEKLQKEIAAKQEYFENIQGAFNAWNVQQNPPVSCDDIRSNTNMLQTALTLAKNARKRLQDDRKKAAEKAEKEAKAAEEALKKAAAEAAKKAEADKKAEDAKPNDEPMIESEDAQKPEPEISSNGDNGAMEVDA